MNISGHIIVTSHDLNCNLWCGAEHGLTHETYDKDHSADLKFVGFVGTWLIFFLCAYLHVPAILSEHGSKWIKW